MRCPCGYSLMAKLQLPKLAMRVRFPLPAPKRKEDALSIFFSFLVQGSVGEANDCLEEHEGYARETF